MDDQLPNDFQQQSITTITDTSKLLEQKDSPIVRIRKQLDQIRINLLFLLSPGDKQFKDLPKRVRLMFVSFAIPILFGVSKWVLPTSFDEPFFWLLIALVLGALTYGGVYWGVKAQVRKEALQSIMTIPSIFVSAYSLFMFVLFVGPVNRVFLWVLLLMAISMFMIVLYVLSLAINILNVTLFYTIPLSRLGETIAYMAGVISVFFYSFVATSISMNFLLANQPFLALTTVFLYIIIMFFVTRYLWLYFIPYQRGVESFTLITALFLSLLTIGFGLVMPAVWQVAVCISACSYVLFGQVIHKEQNTLKPTVIAEFSVIIAILFIFVISV